MSDLPSLSLEKVFYWSTPSKTYVGPLSLDLNGDQTVLIVGARECDLFKLFRILSRQDDAYQGSIYWNDLTVGSLVREPVALYGWTVQECLTYHGMLTGQSLRDRKQVISTLQLEGIMHLRCESDLSVDQHHRVQLAIEAFYDTNVFLMYDPLVGMDSVEALQFMNILKDFQRERRVLTVVLGHHLTDNSLMNFDRVVLLHRTGHLLASSHPKSLPRAIYTVTRGEFSWGHVPPVSLRASQIFTGYPTGDEGTPLGRTLEGLVKISHSYSVALENPFHDLAPENLPYGDEERVPLSPEEASSLPPPVRRPAQRSVTRLGNTLKSRLRSLWVVFIVMTWAILMHPLNFLKRTLQQNVTTLIAIPIAVFSGANIPSLFLVSVALGLLSPLTSEEGAVNSFHNPLTPSVTRFRRGILSGRFSLMSSLVLQATDGVMRHGPVVTILILIVTLRSELPFVYGVRGIVICCMYIIYSRWLLTSAYIIGLTTSGAKRLAAIHVGVTFMFSSVLFTMEDGWINVVKYGVMAPSAYEYFFGLRELQGKMGELPPTLALASLWPLVFIYMYVSFYRVRNYFLSKPMSSSNSYRALHTRELVELKSQDISSILGEDDLSPEDTQFSSVEL